MGSKEDRRARLRRLAKQMDPPRWTSSGTNVQAGGGKWVRCWDGVTAAYIAAADPVAVLELLDDIERMGRDWDADIELTARAQARVTALLGRLEPAARDLRSLVGLTIDPATRLHLLRVLATLRGEGDPVAEALFGEPAVEVDTLYKRADDHDEETAGHSPA